MCCAKRGWAALHQMGPWQSQRVDSCAERQARKLIWSVRSHQPAIRVVFISAAVTTLLFEGAPNRIDDSLSHIDWRRGLERKSAENLLPTSVYMMGQRPLERPLGICRTEIEGDLHKTHLNTSFRCRIAQQSAFGDGRFQRGVGLVC